MKYLVQIDGTNPQNWREISATNREAAVLIAAKPLILDGHNPQTAYVGLGESRHANGTPICVQSYSLKVNREAKPMNATWRVADGNVLYAGDTFVALIHRGSAQKIADSLNALLNILRTIEAFPSTVTPEQIREAVTKGENP